MLLSLHAFPQLLKIHESQRYLVRENGEAFFWLGDTAWELFHRLDGEEVMEYLENRAELSLLGKKIRKEVIPGLSRGLHLCVEAHP